jgi:hypothetical protein
MRRSSCPAARDRRQAPTGSKITARIDADARPILLPLFVSTFYTISSGGFATVRRLRAARRSIVPASAALCRPVGLFTVLVSV